MKNSLNKLSTPKMDQQPQEWKVSGNVKARLQHLLKTETWTDCHFLVGPESNCKLIGAHKLILCISSPVFQAMLRGELADNVETIHVPDVEPGIFELLLKYIYTDEISAGSVDEAIKLYYAAEKYMLPIVTDHCLAYLQSAINPANVCRIYEFAKFYRHSNITYNCLNYIRLNTKQVIQHENFMEVDLNTIIEIFDQEKLAIDNELDLYRALSKYALEHDLCPSNDSAVVKTNNPGKEPEKPAEKGHVKKVSSNGECTTTADDDSRKPVNSAKIKLAEAVSIKSDQVVKPTVRDALRRIRFLTLTPQQLASEFAKLDLLMLKESFAILMNAHTVPDNGFPMPEGFSTSKAGRK
ncbi:actin-binding protein IPP-like [Topomyia yanbarensis]|uniref:actin-binding protein IPP-like n=1 Tax=Topomyia yanbarensis TaxID=2498891 RepID=UPI00273C07D2|nr:actin-binding protein IPP-like [Topomyia yanbarensis]XP_058824700.1 actin-binding protein IPP-like [Topomyia yanbarensis]